jgi:hypothetical protein
MEGGPTIPHLGISRPKKREPTAPAANMVLPMEFQVDDRLAEETGTWEVGGRPYTTAGRKTVNVRVQRTDWPNVTAIRTWGAHERVNVKRTTAEEGKR